MIAREEHDSMVMELIIPGWFALHDEREHYKRIRDTFSYEELIKMNDGDENWRKVFKRYLKFILNTAMSLKKGIIKPKSENEPTLSYSAMYRSS